MPTALNALLPSCRARKSGRGLPQSKTLRVQGSRRHSRQRLGLRQPSGAFLTPWLNRHKWVNSLSAHSRHLRDFHAFSLSDAGNLPFFG